MNKAPKGLSTLQNCVVRVGLLTLSFFLLKLQQDQLSLEKTYFEYCFLKTFSAACMLLSVCVWWDAVHQNVWSPPDLELTSQWTLEPNPSLYKTREGTKSSPSSLPAPNPVGLHQDSEHDQIRALVGLSFSFAAEEVVRLFLLFFFGLSVTYHGAGWAEQRIPGD